MVDPLLGSSLMTFFSLSCFWKSSASCCVALGNDSDSVQNQLATVSFHSVLVSPSFL